MVELTVQWSLMGDKHTCPVPCLIKWIFVDLALLTLPHTLLLERAGKNKKMWSSPCPRQESIHSSTHSYPRSFSRAKVGPLSRSGRFGVQKNLLPLLGLEPRSVQPLAKWLHLMRYPGFKNGLRLAELQRCHVQGPYSLSCHYMCWQSQLLTVKKGAEVGRKKW
jgi:hypothetical protein